MGKEDREYNRNGIEMLYQHVIATALGVDKDNPQVSKLWLQIKQLNEAQPRTFSTITQDDIAKLSIPHDKQKLVTTVAIAMYYTDRIADTVDAGGPPEMIHMSAFESSVNRGLARVPATRQIAADLEAAMLLAISETATTVEEARKRQASLPGVS